VADLEKAVRRIRRPEVEKALGKTERLNLLVTPQQKKEIRAAAERYGLSMTDYLVRIHALVEDHSRSARSKN
jgi:hypothetical protein